MLKHCSVGNLRVCAMSYNFYVARIGFYAFACLVTPKVELLSKLLSRLSNDEIILKLLLSLLKVRRRLEPDVLGHLEKSNV